MGEEMRKVLSKEPLKLLEMLTLQVSPLQSGKMVLATLWLMGAVYKWMSWKDEKEMPWALGVTDGFGPTGSNVPPKVLARHFRDLIPKLRSKQKVAMSYG